MQPHADASPIIRAATSDDFEAIIALNGMWEHFTSPLDDASLARLHSQAAFHSVAVLDNSVVAFLIALREGADYASPNYRWFDTNAGDGFLYIDRIVIDESMHGAGLAARLYDGLFEFARTQGIVRVVCEVNIEPPNEASRRFHARYGFTEVGTQWIDEGTKLVSLIEAHIS